jgi:hypothetical protein
MELSRPQPRAHRIETDYEWNVIVRTNLKIKNKKKIHSSFTWSLHYIKYLYW